MEFAFTPEQEAFRAEVRAWIAANLPKDWRGIYPDTYYTDENWKLIRSLTSKLSERGWLTLAWPREYGGQGRSHMEQLVYKEEMAYHRVPTRDVLIGVQLVGPTLMIYGSEAQKREYLPRIASGEAIFFQGFSEPESGSDLASLSTRAVEDGDDFVVNGGKIWSSGAQASEFCYLLARTDPQAPKHKGISAFIVDMRTRGITVKPVRDMMGNHYFNQVFFDSVRVPKRNLLGQRGQGWYVAATSLDFERSGVDRFATNRRMLEELVEIARERGANRDPHVRHRLADLWISNLAGTLVAYKVAWAQSKGQVPNKEASISKLWGSEVGQQIATFGMDLMGLAGVLDQGSPWAVHGGRPAREWANQFSWTIRAGTSEIQRNIIAGRGLGLPRD